MSYNVAGLPNYVKDHVDVLITKSLFDAKTQTLIQQEGNVQTGIKSSENLTLMDTDAVFQDGGSCSFSPSGTTTFSNRTITVGKIKVHETLCPKILEAKATQQKLKAGSVYQYVPFEKEYTDLKARVIAEQLEVAIWQGDTLSGNVNLNKFDGLLKIIDAGPAVDVNVAQFIGTPITVATGILASNVLSIVKALKNGLPARVKGKPDCRFWCGWDVFDLIVDAHVAANLYHYGQQNLADGEFIIPGTQYKITAVHGLNDTDRLVGIRTSNIYLGTDLLNEEEKWELFYAAEAMEMRFVAEWKLGVQTAYPGEIVEFTLIP